MSLIKNTTRFYAIIHHPTEFARPVVLRVTAAAPWSDELFKKYVKESNEIVERFGGGNRHMLTKRDLEIWGSQVPCGARAQVVEFDLQPWHLS